MSVALSLAEHFAACHDRNAEVETQLKRYRDVADICPIPVVMVDPKLGNTYANQAYCNMLGCSYHSLLGHGWKHFIHPDDLLSVVESWEGFLNDASRTAYQRDMRFVRGDGMIAYTHVSVTKIRGNGLIGYLVPVALQSMLASFTGTVARSVTA